MSDQTLDFYREIILQASSIFFSASSTMKLPEMSAIFLRHPINEGITRGATCVARTRTSQSLSTIAQFNPLGKFRPIRCKAVGGTRASAEFPRREKLVYQNTVYPRLQ